ncbi:APC family permease [Nocardioides marmoribigeumensis]|uniref:Amino acid transporter n=1 Tax=Nocardioides marmoribigeumensis TaxID=433649 RepID=A0ABU2BZA5_9ACTN|nr:APC family permease [Nocardioides marmoribigeumensis]MDR7363728.1 amino acid transporter [Nocardioides marmoribigeumensis]
MSASISTASSTTSATTRPDGGIGLWSCVAFAVGTMVGAGVFVLSGLAVERAGPAALASFVLAGVLVLLSALSFTVVASRAGQGESGYAYVGRALGGYWRFFALWAFYVGGVIGVAFVLGAFGAYVHDFFVDGVPALVWAVAGAVVLTLLNLGPADLIGRAETALVALKVGILALLIVFAFIHLDRASFTPFAPHGASSVVTTSGLLFVAYLGFNVVCSMAPEVRDARRTIPRAIVLSMAIVVVVYLGVVVALLAGGITTYDEASVGQAAENLMGSWGGVLIPVAALVSTLSAANANILGSSEIMVRLAVRKDVPTVLGRMWHGHPAVSVLGGAVLYVVLLLTGSTDSVVSLANVAAIAAMAVVNVGAYAAMRHDPRGGVRLPGGPVLPVLGLVTALSQLFFLDWVPVLVGAGLLAAGSVLYLVRHRFHHPVDHAALQHEVDHGRTPGVRAVGGRRRVQAQPEASAG